MAIEDIAMEDIAMEDIVAADRDGSVPMAQWVGAADAATPLAANSTAIIQLSTNRRMAHG
jgi:hypothetical protein